MEHYQLTPLWKNAFEEKKDEFDGPRTKLRTAYLEFRSRVEILLQQINKELPSLTCHDITHVDSLWRVASEIAGPDFDLNPAEAFVLGGAFLLHDAAHCRAAFPGGLQDLQQTTEWKDSTAHHGFTPDLLVEGTEPFQTVLFNTLRQLHPQRAQHLPFAKWPSGDGGSDMYLLPSDELRYAYGEVIGEIAASHWLPPQELEILAGKKLTAPTCLAPANWIIDSLKLAVLLRTADAAHVDANRAPRFLMYMIQPQGISKEHWLFQSRLHQPTCNERNELVISGSPFPEKELSAWWLAYDVACLANKELMAADRLLMDNHRPRLAARSVADTHSPEAFSKCISTVGWHPVNTNIKITDVKRLVEHFGGAKLYGDDPSAALREMLQNAVDAVHACRKLGGLGPYEGEVDVAIEESSGGHWWLHVTDTGIGMSRYVLTDVLLDFGNSFWRSTDVHGEWCGLASSGFEAIGQFGIGFYSVFMLGEQVRVVTKRYVSKSGEADQWLLNFADGVNKRPTLREPVGLERLRRHGTRVSVLISDEKLKALCTVQKRRGDSSSISLAQACARLAPAINMNLYVKAGSEERQLIVQPNDWLSIPPIDLLRRISPGYLESTPESQFGLWTHVTSLFDDTGNIIGRCAVQPNSYRNYNFGIGVVNGLLAGNVPGIAGIIMSKPQNDLARKEAIPGTSLSSIQLWAESQKEILLRNKKLSARYSLLLAYFGASHDALKLGTLGGKTVTVERLVRLLADLKEIVVYDGDIIHEPDEDKYVTSNDFEESFEVINYVLEFPYMYQYPKWIDKTAASTDTWSLEAVLEEALMQAWGQAHWDEDNVTVGYVNGDDIDRDCRVARRFKDVDDDG